MSEKKNNLLNSFINKSSEKTLFVYFYDKEATNGKSIVLVGELTYKTGKYIFKYTKGDRKIEGLEDHEATSLHSFFRARLPDKNRPNISEIYKSLPQQDFIEILNRLSEKSPLSSYIFSTDKEYEKKYNSKNSKN